MKNFVKENWYKLMIGSSLFIFSVGFFINSVSPVYSSNTNKEKTDIVNQGFGRYFQDAKLPSGQRIGDVKSVDLSTGKPIDVTISETEVLPVGKNGVNYNDGVLFVDGGYVYIFKGSSCSDSRFDSYWTKRKLP
jgi:hypothetical protein